MKFDRLLIGIICFLRSYLMMSSLLPDKTTTSTWANSKKLTQYIYTSFSHKLSWLIES